MWSNLAEVVLDATGATSGALQNISQVDDADGLHYEQFEARDEYKFYLYDLKFEIDATTKEKYKLSECPLPLALCLS